MRVRGARGGGGGGIRGPGAGRRKRTLEKRSETSAKIYGSLRSSRVCPTVQLRRQQTPSSFWQGCYLFFFFFFFAVPSSTVIKSPSQSLPPFTQPPHPRHLAPRGPPPPPNAHHRPDHGLLRGRHRPRPGAGGLRTTACACKWGWRRSGGWRGILRQTPTSAISPPFFSSLGLCPPARRARLCHGTHGVQNERPGRRGLHPGAAGRDRRGERGRRGGQSGGRHGRARRGRAGELDIRAGFTVERN